MKKLILTIFICMCFCFINKVYAYEVNDKIADDEFIEEVNSLDITIKGEKVEINNFLSNKWRTYVSLEDLCSLSIGVCNIESSNDEEIKLTKKYENIEDAHYETVYNYEKNEYTSKLVAPNSLDFSFGTVATTPDVKPVTIDSQLYVPIRFIVEALGAEVIYDNTNKDENAKITIDFYSNMNKVFNVSFIDSDDNSLSFKDLKNGNCYDIIVNTGVEEIKNPKLFSNNSEFVKINYNDNKNTNICLNDEVGDKSLSFVFNYNNVPIIYIVNQNTINSDVESDSEEQDEKDDVNEAKEIDKIYIDGDITSISKDNEVKAKIRYEGSNLSFENYIKMKWQGNSSLNYEKKNYTIKLYEDRNYSNKKSLNVLNWPSLDKFVLKANYTDYTQGRNIISAKIWGEVVKSRTNLNEKLKNTVNGGAIDGYPVMLYINNQAQGLYTFNIPKTEETFNISGDNEYLIMSDGWDQDNLFKSATVDFDNKDTNWEVIYGANSSNDEIEQSINSLIDFTINNDGENFKNGIGNYLDVDATIDYIIHMYYTTAADNTSKNILWVSYDKVKWFPSMYDMDATFGNGNENNTFYTPDTMLPYVSSDGVISSSTPNEMLLWSKMLNNFRTEIKNRYFELRKEILTLNNVKEKFEEFRTYISEENLEENLNVWPNLPNHDEDVYKQVYDNIEQREKIFDEIMNNF